MATISSVDDLYNFLLSSNGRIVANANLYPWSPGQMTTELDNFLRMKHLGEISANIPYVMAMPEGFLPTYFAQVYSHVLTPAENIHYIVNSRLHAIAHKLCLMAPELTIDAGLSHTKAALADRSRTRITTTAMGDQHYTVRNEVVIEDHRQYFRRKSQTPAYRPWVDGPALDEPLLDLLGPRSDKIALVHLRYGEGASGNAGTLTDPARLFPTLGCLRDMGYTLVKFGIEPCPPEFARFGVVNYSQSPLRSFRNDLILARAAKLALVNASGVENVPELMGVPTVSYGRWILPLQPSLANCVIVPSMLRDRRSGRLLKFAEQVAAFHARPQPWEPPHTGWCFPAAEFEERPPENDEILEAVREAIALGEEFKPRSPLQDLFMTLDPSGCFAYMTSRVGQFFLERFEKAVVPGFDA